MKNNGLHKYFNNKTQEKPAFFPKSPAYLLLPKKVFSFHRSLFQYRKTLSARFTSVAGSSPECKTLLPYCAYLNIKSIYLPDIEPNKQTAY